jgi:hypothetical protein
VRSKGGGGPEEEGPRQPGGTSRVWRRSPEVREEQAGAGERQEATSKTKVVDTQPQFTLLKLHPEENLRLEANPSSVQILFC